MKNILALVVVVAASVPSFGFQNTAGGWIRFTSDAGRFSVLMPGPTEPKDEPETRTDPKAGQTTVHRFLQKTDKGLFWVGWCEYAPDARLDAQGVLAANRDSLVKSLNARMTSEHPVALGDSPGIEFVAESEQATYRSRVYVVGQRPYLVIAATLKGLDDAANVERFLASFQLKTPDR
jgi:hypothetical protein